MELSSAIFKRRKVSFHFPSAESQSKVIPSMQFTFPIKLLGRLVSLQLSNDWFIFNFLYRLPLLNNAPKQSNKECIQRDTPSSLYSILRYLKGHRIWDWASLFSFLILCLKFEPSVVLYSLRYICYLSSLSPTGFGW